MLQEEPPESEKPNTELERTQINSCLLGKQALYHYNMAQDYGN